MAAIGFDAIKFDCRSQGRIAARNVFGDNPVAVAGNGAADGGSIIDRFNGAGLIFGNAGVRVEPQPPSFSSDEKIEEDVAIEKRHHLPAKLLDLGFGIAGPEQACGNA